MNQKQLYYKTDFQVILDSDTGWGGVPFRLLFYTNSPARGYIASYDGEQYNNCHLEVDGRLCVAFDDHRLGLGQLHVQPTFYLDNECYRTGVCDDCISPFLVELTAEDGSKYGITLALQGDKSVVTVGTLPAYYQKGDPGQDADIEGCNRAIAEAIAAANNANQSATAANNAAAAVNGAAERAEGAVTAANTAVETIYNENNIVSDDADRELEDIEQAAIARAIKAAEDAERAAQMIVGGGTSSSAVLEVGYQRESILHNINAIEGWTITDAGVLKESAGSYVTDYIPVVGGKVYYALNLGTSKLVMRIYDSNKNYIDYYKSYQAPYGSGVVSMTMPDNAAFVQARCTIDKQPPCLSERQPLYVNSTSTPSDVISFDTKYPFPKGLLEKIIGVGGYPSTLWFKKWRACGDSITNGIGTTKTYHAYLADKYKMQVINVGSAGAMISGDGDYPKKAIYKELDGVVDGVYDIITIFAGTNDYGSQVELGTSASTGNDTLWGALNNLLSYIAETFVETSVVFLTPIHRANENNGISLATYVGVIKEACAKYGIPCIDLYSIGRMAVCDSVVKQRIMPDGTHPNADGHKMLARAIESMLPNYIYNLDKYNVVDVSEDDEPATPPSDGGDDGDDEPQNPEVTDTISLSKTSGVLVAGGSVDTIQVTASGAFTAQSNNSGVASVTISGNTATITPVADGNAIVTFTCGTATAKYIVTVAATAGETPEYPKISFMSSENDSYSVEVTGNHFKVTRKDPGANNGNFAFHGANNTTNAINPLGRSSLFKLQNAGTIEVKISNFEGAEGWSGTGGGRVFIQADYKSGSYYNINAQSSGEDVANSMELAAGSDFYGIWLHAGYFNAGKSVEFDVELTLDGESLLS